MDKKDKVKKAFYVGEDICLEVNIKSRQSMGNVIVGFSLRNNIGLDLIGINTKGIKKIEIKKNKNTKIKFKFKNFLKEGDYFVNFGIIDSKTNKFLQRNFNEESFKVINSYKIRSNSIGFVDVPIKIQTIYE